MSKNTKQLLLLFIVVSFVYLLFPSPIIASFTKYSSNPILSNGSPTEWDGLDIATPMVLYEGNEYKMWYAGANGPEAHIGYATSSDGINWTKHAGNPVLSKDPSDPSEISINETTVIKVGDVYKMWYLSTAQHTGPGSEVYRVKYATSPDGISWTRHGFVLRRSNSWESEGIVADTVLFQDDKYKMWYSARDSSGKWRIGYAESDDGINDWTRNSNPILVSEFDWEGTTVAAASVIFQDGKYHMYYHAGPVVPHYIGHATSSDGINWEKDINPIMVRGGFTDFDKNMIAWPRVLRVNNKLHLYYGGYNGAHWQFGLAEELLPIPYYAQNDSLWGEREYNTASLWSYPYPNDISTWGCAISSVVMVLKHFNVQKTPGNPEKNIPIKDLTPESLNEWLISYNDGYLPNGRTNWAVIASRLTKKAHELDPLSPKLEYFASPSAELTTILNNQTPAILNVSQPLSPNGGHYVVASKVNINNYDILDPLHSEYNTLYPNYSTINSVGYYQPSNTDYSYLILSIDEVVEISLTDIHGNQVGYQYIDPPIYNDKINNNLIYKPLRMLYFKQPPAGTYTLKISASGNQTFQLDTYLYDKNGNGGLKTFTGIVGPTDTDTYSINIVPEDSESSVIQNQITPTNLINDINTAYKLKWLNKAAYKVLLPQAKYVQNMMKRNRKLLAKTALKTMQSELNLFKKLKLINQEAYNLLKSDIDTLLSGL